MEYKTNRDKEFASIYEEYQDDIYKVAFYYTKNEEEAHDIAQKAFYGLYLHFDDVDLSKVRTYLIRTARNMAYNSNRITKFEKVTEDIYALKEMSDCVEGLEDAYIREENEKEKNSLSRTILENLRKENEQWYEALNLAYCMNMPQEKVAEELGITLVVLHSRLYRAKKWIRKNYREEYEAMQRSFE